MHYTHLGRTGLSVSRLCLGSLNFGPVTEAADAFQIMDGAQASGVNFFDTSNSYGRHLGRGTAERIIGEWFSQGGDRRSRTVLATKLFVAMDDADAAFDVRLGRESPPALTAALESRSDVRVRFAWDTSC